MLLPCARGAWPILHRVTHQSTAHSIPVYLTTQHRPISHPWFRRGSGGLVYSFPVVVNVYCGCKVIPINTQQIGKMWGGKSLPFLLVSERPFLCRCSECVCVWGWGEQRAVKTRTVTRKPVTLIKERWYDYDSTNGYNATIFVARATTVKRCGEWIEIPDRFVYFPLRYERLYLYEVSCVKTSSKKRKQTTIRQCNCTRNGMLGRYRISSRQANKQTNKQNLYGMWWVSFRDFRVTYVICTVIYCKILQFITPLTEKLYAMSKK